MESTPPINFPAAPPPDPPLVASVPTKRSRKKFVIVALIGAAVLFGAALSVYLFANGQTRETAVDKTSKGAVDRTASVSADFSSAYDKFAASGITEFSVDKKSATLRETDALLAGFDFATEPFTDDMEYLMALGMARLSVDDSSHFDEYRNEMYLLVQPYLRSLPTGISDSTFVGGGHDAEILKIYEKYTDQGLTSQVNSAIASRSVPDMVKEKLKVSNLREYHIVALDFDNSSARQKEFAAEHSMFGADPAMWSEQIDGEEYIFLSKSYAEEVVAGDSADSIIQHELIHTQQAFGSGNLGYVFEERRAELLSGDKSAYYDVKQFIIYIQVFSGVDLLTQMESAPTDPTAFYIMLYKSLGLRAGNAVAAAWPVAYLGGDSGAIERANRFFGAPDSVIQHAIELGAKDITAMESRIDRRNERLLSVYGDKDAVIEDLDDNVSGAYRMPSAATEVKKYIK